MVGKFEAGAQLFGPERAGRHHRFNLQLCRINLDCRRFNFLRLLTESYLAAAWRD